MHALLKRNLKKSYEGFTLVELLVIIGIIAVLGTIGFINLGGYQRSARDSARIENLANLQIGLNRFHAES
jgi:type II secretory pathway pseudopilin PulG